MSNAWNYHNFFEGELKRGGTAPGRNDFDGDGMRAPKTSYPFMIKTNVAAGYASSGKKSGKVVGSHMSSIQGVGYNKDTTGTNNSAYLKAMKASSAAVSTSGGAASGVKSTNALLHGGHNPTAGNRLLTGNQRPTSSSYGRRAFSNKPIKLKDFDSNFFFDHNNENFVGDSDAPILRTRPAIVEESNGELDYLVQASSQIRPPGRKKDPKTTTNLDDGIDNFFKVKKNGFVNQNTEKPEVTVPKNKVNTQGSNLVRPPSRHKVPTKNIGLELPTKANPTTKNQNGVIIHRAVNDAFGCEDGISDDSDDDSDVLDCKLFIDNFDRREFGKRDKLYNDTDEFNPPDNDEGKDDPTAADVAQVNFNHSFDSKPSHRKRSSYNQKGSSRATGGGEDPAVLSHAKGNPSFGNVKVMNAWEAIETKQTKKMTPEPHDHQSFKPVQNPKSGFGDRFKRPQSGHAGNSKRVRKGFNPEFRGGAVGFEADTTEEERAFSAVGLSKGKYCIDTQFDMQVNPSSMMMMRRQNNSFQANRNPKNRNIAIGVHDSGCDADQEFDKLSRGGSRTKAVFDRKPQSAKGRSIPNSTKASSTNYVNFETSLEPEFLGLFAPSSSNLREG